MSCSYKIINLLKQTCHNVCTQVGIVLQSHDLGKISYTWAWNIFKSVIETTMKPSFSRCLYLPASFSIFTTCTHRQKFLTKIFILLVNQFYFIWWFFCMCMYVYVYVPICIGLYMCMWRPEVDMGCVPQMLFTLFACHTKVSWAWCLQIWLRSLASLSQESYLHLPITGIAHLAFRQSLKTQTPVFMLTCKVFYVLGHIPSSILFLG